MSFGQNSAVPGKFPFPKSTEQFTFDKSPFSNSITRGVGDQQSTWINFASTLNDLNGTTYSLSGFIMAPDTLLNIRYVKDVGGKYEFTYGNPFVCAAGATFELNSAVLQLPNFFGNTQYSVDSAAIQYIYRRYTADDVVDTLIVQVYNPAKMLTGWQFTISASEKRSFAIPFYKRATNTGSMSDYTVKIPLTIADTSEALRFRLKDFIIPSWNLANGGAVALTYSFKPGRTYNLGDTIPYAKWDSVQGVYRPINLFRCAVYMDEGKNSLSPETNHGLWILNWCRYKDWSTQAALAGTYVPGNYWTSSLYPIVFFKVSYTESVGINHLAKDVKVQLYPSPTTSAQDMMLDMTLDSRKNISIDVYDLLGHKVSSVTSGTFNSGKHSFSVGTSELNSGMYICNIVADGAVKTIKFQVR